MSKMLDIEVKVSAIEKIAVVHLMVAAGTLAGIFGFLLFNFPSPGKPLIKSSTTAIDEELILPEYVKGQLLVKFKASADVSTTIKKVLDEPQIILREQATGKVLKPGTVQYLEATRSGLKSEKIVKESKTVKLKEEIQVFKESIFAKSRILTPTTPAAKNFSEKGLDRWRLITLDTNDVNVVDLQKQFFDTGDVERAEPNYIFKTSLNAPPVPELSPDPGAEVSTDPFLFSSGSWGQSYADLWGLKAIQAPRAWDAVYAKRGDFNNDTLINSTDVSLLSSYLAIKTPVPSPIEIADVNGDDKVTNNDLVYLQAYLANTGPAPVDYSKNKVVIAVSDTGVDYNHSDIFANIWINVRELPNNQLDDDGNGFVDDIRGWNFVNEGNNPMDDQGHGTHVAGSIAAMRNNKDGIAGVCPHCLIMPVKGLGADGSGYANWLAKTIIYAADNGADVMNMSWGAKVAFSLVINDAITYAKSAGVTLIAAAGNSNDDVNNFIPANISDVITVSATDHVNTRAAFSNWGSKVDVSAPGGDSGLINGANEPTPYQSRNILSLRAENTDMYGDGLSIVNNWYYRSRGTSMAAPYVAGVAGLVLAKHPEFSPDQVRAVISLSADDLTRGVGVSCGSSTTESSCTATKFCSWKWKNQYCQYNNQYKCTQVFADSCTWNSSTQQCMNKGECIEDVIHTYGVGWDPYTGYGRINAARALMINNPGALPTASIGAPGNNEILKGTITISGKAYSTNFSAYIIELCDSTGLACTEIKRGTQAVQSGVLGTIITKNFSDGTKLLKLRVQDSKLPERIDRRVVFIGNTLLDGWPFDYKSEGYWRSSFRVADIDVDGDQEIIIFSNKNYRESNTLIVDHTDGNDDGVPDLVSRINSNIIFGGGGAAIGNIDGDPKLEIVLNGAVWLCPNGSYGACTTVTRKYAFDTTDQDSDGFMDILQGWPYHPMSPSDVLSMFDVYRNGKQEIFFNGDGDPQGNFHLQTYGLDGLAQNLLGWPIDHETAFGGLSFGDLDGDGDMEILNHALGAPREDGTRTPKLEAWHHDDKDGDGKADAVTGFPVYTGGLSTSLHPPAIGDVDGDGRPEIVLESFFARGEISGYDDEETVGLYVFGSDGNLKPGWPRIIPHPTDEYPLRVYSTTSPILSDLDKDGAAEIIVSKSAGHSATLVFSGAGELLWSVDKGYLYAPVTGDVDGDGFEEVIVATAREIAAYDRNGKPVSGWPLNLGVLNFIDGSPALIDVNNDRKMELIVQVYNELKGSQLMIFNLPKSSTLATWPMAHHDVQNTSLYNNR